MAINKKLIHFNNFSTFNSKKLSANVENTKYTLGVYGMVQTGSPEILYQSICYIKDTKQQWTHGQLYEGSKPVLPLNETDPVFSNSPAAGITENDKEAWNNKVDAEDINNIKPLIVDFSIGDISAYIHYGTEFNYHSSSIINALQNKQPIYIPYENEGLEGYYPAYGFVEDLIYLDVFCGNTVYILELDLSGGGIMSIDERNSNNFVAESDLADIALTGDYNDLMNKPTIPAEQVNADWNATSGKAQILNKPTIPAAVTERTVSGWGFTKNTGTYSKPSTGIPKSDLATSVQESLSKADNAACVDMTGDLVTIHAQALYDGNMVYATPSAASGNEDDILLSRDNVKTINGESIFGSGNIVISGSGGSSSGGNGAYPEVDGSIYESEWIVGQYDISDMQPNTFYVFPECNELVIQSFGSETAGVANEYLFQFTSGATATSLTLPDDIKWANDTPPTIESNMIYQVSILRGLASVLEFKNAVLISFTINGVPYQAEEGMNWVNFCESSYNDGRVSINGNMLIVNNYATLYYPNGASVGKFDIIEEINYTAAQGGGGGA